MKKVDKDLFVWQNLIKSFTKSTFVIKYNSNDNSFTKFIVGINDVTFTAQYEYQYNSSTVGYNNNIINAGKYTMNVDWRNLMARPKRILRS